MDTNAAIILLLADRQRDIEALRARVAELEQENAELREALTAPTEDGFTRLSNGRRVAPVEGGWVAADAGGWLTGTRATPEDWLTDPEGYTP